MNRGVLIDVDVDVRHLPVSKLSYLLRLSNIFDFDIEASYLSQVKTELMNRGVYRDELARMSRSLRQEIQFH